LDEKYHPLDPDTSQLDSRIPTVHTDSGQKYADTSNFPYIFHIKLQFFKMQSWSKFISVVWFQYVTEVWSNQFIGYMIALQSPYMIALQSPLSSHNWSRDRWQFIDVQRSLFLELKVNNSFIHSIRLIILKDCAVYFNIIFSVYLRYFERKTNCDLWIFMRFSVKVVSLHKQNMASIT
jgi:hypothetical protein